MKAIQEAVVSSEHGVDGIPGYLHGFALMHRAIRRDARRLVGVAPAVAADPRRLAGVGAWWERLRAVIDWHHHSEDEQFWPEIRRRTGVRVEDVLDDDHVELDRVMGAVSAALASPAAAAALPGVAAEFDALVHGHLRREEAAVFPVLARVGVRDYLAVERRLVASAPGSLRAYLQPWMFDGADPHAVANVQRTIPAPVRVLGGTVLRRRYARVLAEAGM